MKQYAVAVIGCGLIGRRRAHVAAAHEATRLALVVDNDAATARAAGAELGVAHETRWERAVEDPAIDVVIVAAPNALHSPVTTAALQSGKHVLVEKPMGRNAAESRSMAEAAQRGEHVLKVGFNHRYHPAVTRARDLLHHGEIGELISIRARYGHGGRPGYEREWRGNLELAGGGELTDQGVHIADLIHWLAGLPLAAFAYTQTAAWPIAPLEDNAFGLFRFASGVVASFHTSWTQWENLFSLEVFGTLGSLTVEGLGRSYGTERLIVTRRDLSGGLPDVGEVAFDKEDQSWELEWADFVSAVRHGTPYWGTPEDGVIASRMIDALYESARSRREVSL